MIRLRAEATSTSHSLPLPPPFILSPTRSDAPSSGIPPPLPILVPTSSPPLLLPSASHREDRPEVTLQPRKRLGITLGPRYELQWIGDQAFDPEMRLEWRSGYGITTTWGGDEARLSREAWRRSMDASDLTRGEVMSLRTTVVGQMSEIRELHAADRRRHAVTSGMLKADHRRSAVMRELRTADRDHTTGTGDHTTGTGDSTTGTAGTLLRSCTARATRGARDANRNGDDSHTSGTGVRGSERVARECTYQDLMKCLTWWNSHVLDWSVYDVAKYANDYGTSG
ncbi:hypothetical protein Tco_1253532 [Tanacetum coccineum]